MNAKSAIVAFASCLLIAPAFAVSNSPKDEYASAKKSAATRYAEDRKLCADESSSSMRMQCLRDAKSEYNKSLVAAKEAYNKVANGKAATPAAKAVVATICAECGKVTSVRIVEKEGESSPLGMIAGGVAGAVLGHQVGDGRGKDLATIAGAAGGAYAGHKIEQNMKKTKSWVVSIRFENGAERDYAFAADPGYTSGDAVKLSDNGIVKR